MSRHRVCDHRPHRLIRVWVSAAALMLVAGIAVLYGVMLGSADRLGYAAEQAVACTAPTEPSGRGGPVAGRAPGSWG